MAGITLEEVHVAHTRKRQFRLYNVLVILGMAFASVGMGYSASIIATTLAQPSFIEYFDLATRPDALSLISTMNGLFQAGSFFGALMINFVADRWGRKMAITIPSILVLISGACLGGAANIGMFLAFRFFSGMGSWMLLGSVPVWMSEIVPPKNRGLLVDIHSAALLTGYFAATWAGFGFYHFHPAANNQWRAPLALQSAPVFIVLCVMYWLPESPRWLIQQGRHEQARRVLYKLHDAEEAAIEYAQIEAQVQVDSTLPITWMSMITKPSYRKRTILAIGLACGIQFTGVLVINNYGARIYEGLGFSTSQTLLYQAGYITLSLGTGIMAIFVIDLLPRPKLIALGVFLTISCLTVEAALVANYPVGPKENTSALKAAAAMTFCYIAFAELILDGTQYVYFAEMFPNHLRAKGMTIGMAAIALMNIMWLQSAPTAFANIGWKFYLAFIIPGYLFAIVVYFFYPDTRGLPLEEVAAIFGDADEIFTGTLEIGTPTTHDEKAVDEEKNVNVMAEHRTSSE